jgi:hypothetical protein
MDNGFYFDLWALAIVGTPAVIILTIRAHRGRKSRAWSGYKRSPR